MDLVCSSLPGHKARKEGFKSTLAKRRVSIQLHDHEAGIQEAVAHLSGPFAERPHCLDIIDTVPGRPGHKTSGFANRSWRGNIELAEPGAFAEIQNTRVFTHTIKQKLTFRCTGSPKPSDYSHRCSHSQRYTPSLYLTIHTRYRLTCSASIHTYRPVHTLKPRKTQMVIQFTGGHTAIFQRGNPYTHRQ